MLGIQRKGQMFHMHPTTKKFERCRATAKKGCPFPASSSHVEYGVLHAARMYTNLLVQTGNSTNSTVNRIGDVSEDQLRAYYQSEFSPKNERLKGLVTQEASGRKNLNNDDYKEISSHLTDYFNSRLLDPEFKKLVTTGKEVGQTISSTIDTESMKLLADKGYDIVSEIDDSGFTKSRSEGDFWVNEKNYINPINIKTGIDKGEDMKGRPNMTSYRRLVKNVIKGKISSYYLGIVKFKLSDNGEVTAQAYFFDALDYLDCMVYNSGPGQVMINPPVLYNTLESEGLRDRQDDAVRKSELKKFAKTGRQQLKKTDEILKNIENALDGSSTLKDDEEEDNALKLFARTGGANNN